MFRVIIGLVFLNIFWSSQAIVAAEKPLIFSTAPTHSREKTMKMYTPIVKFLSQKTGRKIVLEPAVNFISYGINIQKDHYDLVFDGPHFVGWRIEKFKHQPVVRFPGKIKIIVAAKKDLNLTQYSELAGHRVCTFPSPNMLTMAFLEYFPNPVRQPVPVLAKGFKGLEKCLLTNKKVYAAVLRDKMWKKMKNKDNLYIMFAPKRGYPERTISASSRVDTMTKNKIVEALLSEEAKNVSKVLFKTFKRKNFIAAKPEEYKNLGKLLSPVWGFDLP